MSVLNPRKLKEKQSDHHSYLSSPRDTFERNRQGLYFQKEFFSSREVVSVYNCPLDSCFHQYLPHECMALVSVNGGPYGMKIIWFPAFPAIIVL